MEFLEGEQKQKKIKQKTIKYFIGYIFIDFKKI
jgi:hypothetical protein